MLKQLLVVSGQTALYAPGLLFAFVALLANIEHKSLICLMLKSDLVCDESDLVRFYCASILRIHPRCRS